MVCVNPLQNVTILFYNILDDLIGLQLCYFLYLFTNSLHKQEMTTAVGTEINIPDAPNTDVHIHMENKSQSGFIPVLRPIDLGVIKFESRNGMIRYMLKSKKY